VEKNEPDERMPATQPAPTAKPSIAAAIAKLTCLRVGASDWPLITNWRPNRLAANSSDSHTFLRFSGGPSARTLAVLNKVMPNATHCVIAVRILRSHFEKALQAAAATQGTEDTSASGRSR